MPKEQIEFVCPKCGRRDGLEEIQVDVTVATSIWLSRDKETDGIITNYGEQTNEGGHVERYQCQGCGFVALADTPEFEKYTQDGLDEHALADRIKDLNSPKPPVLRQMVSHDELIERMVHQLRELDGEELADFWNGVNHDQVAYEGDSLYWVESNDEGNADKTD